MQYVLNNSVMCKYTKDDELIISTPGVDVMTVTEDGDVVCDIFEIFMKPHTYEESFELINLKHYIDQHHYSEYFEFFRTNNILKEVIPEKPSSLLSDYHFQKYDRQLNSFRSLPGVETDDAISIQKKICSSCVYNRHRWYR